MTLTKNNSYVKVISFILALITAFSALTLTTTSFEAASKPQTAYTAVKKAYGKKFPLTNKNVIKGKKRIMGVKTSDLKSYYAASKTTGKKNAKSEYLIFVAEVKNKNNVNKVKSQLVKFKSNEESSMKNYLSSTGKKLFKNAKIGVKGKYVYIVMLDTSSNKKAVNALKKALK